jgi:hypothetical protein
MSTDTLIRAWKDEELESPAGSLELTDSELDLVAGGGRRRHGGGTVNICGAFTNTACVLRTVIIACHSKSVNVS